MIPDDEPVTRLRNEAVPLTGGAAGAVVHREAALPLLLDGTLEYRGAVGRAQKRRK